MSDAAPPSDPDSYIRGASGSLNRRAVVQVLVGFCLLILVVLTVVLTVEAADENAAQRQLHDNGTPVEVTVTSCEALASGTGITEAGYRCQGTFSLDGHPHAAVIGGTDLLYRDGQTLAGVVDPNDPGRLTTQSAAARTHRQWTAFVPAAITFVVLVLFTIAIGSSRALAHRRRITHPPH